TDRNYRLVYHVRCTRWPTLWSRYHVRSWFWPHCLAASVVGDCRGCLDASRGERQRSRYTRCDSTVSYCRFAIPLHHRSRPNHEMQRTTSQAAIYFLRICHPPFGCVARFTRLAVADLGSR